MDIQMTIVNTYGMCILFLQKGYGKFRCFCSEARAQWVCQDEARAAAASSVAHCLYFTVEFRRYELYAPLGFFKSF